MPNRLKDETSPYLRQHADNPVDWYPYGTDAFAAARAADKPILLSIGYSACHWCHVMAHESFEDPATAALMNELYINIKVDREEHPDVDQVYQHALQVVSEQGGGWPLTMFLLPTGEPYFGGTYFPPQDRYGRPSFRRVLSALAQAYREQRDEVVTQGQKVVEALEQIEGRGRGEAGPGRLAPDFALRAASRLSPRMDRREGGFLGAPKFPNPTSLELQLRGAYRGEPALAEPVLLTLRKMAAGGIYDHLGGGFARYSTDDLWLVPHFEKMLYDNALLLRLYAAGSQQVEAADQARFREVATQTLGWMEREMRDPAGGLYAAQDADSEGVEGKYFVWSPEEIEAAVGPAAAAVFCRCYDVRPGGNWNDPHGHAEKGKSILRVVDSAPPDPEEAALLSQVRAALLAVRSRRVPPGTDDKVLTGWNGLAVTGLAEAGRVFQVPAFVAAARRTADFLLQALRDEHGGLLRTYKGGVAKLPGTLDDHAFVAEGLLALCAATGEGRWLRAARGLMDQALSRFYDGDGGFFMARAADPGEVALPTRPRSLFDSAIPSGMSVACANLLRLAALSPPDDPQAARYRQVAERSLLPHAEAVLRNPFGLSSTGAALDLLQSGVTVTVIVAPTVAAAAPLLAAAQRVYVPDHFPLLSTDEAGVDAELQHLVHGKTTIDGHATAYVCRGETCSAPVTEPASLTQVLAGRGG